MLLSTIFFILCSLYFSIAVYALSKNTKDFNNVIYFFIVMLFSFWSLSLAMLHLISNPEYAVIIRRSTVFSWGIIYSLLLHFTLGISGYYSKIKTMKNKVIFHLCLYVPAFINLVLYLFNSYTANELELTETGWNIVPSISRGFIWDYYFFFYYAIFSVLSIIVLIVWYKNTTVKREKKQAFGLLFGYIFAVVVGSIFEIVLPINGINIMYGITLIISLFPMIIILYSINNYGLLNFSPEKIGWQAMDLTSEGMIIFTLNGNIKSINDGALNLLEYEDKTQLTNVKQIGIEDTSGIEFLSKEVELLDKSGNSVYVLMNSKKVIDSIGELYGSLVIFQNISLLKESQDEILKLNSGLEDKIAVRTKELSKLNEELLLEVKQRISAENAIKEVVYRDHLTGIFNRRFYDMTLNEIDSESNFPLTVVMCDINGLKLINDAFGHKAGDELLIAASKILTETCRDTDIVSRVGGDEFVILMPNTNSEEAEDVITLLAEEAKKVSIHHIDLSISYGYTTKYDTSESIHDKFIQAEDLMYREKLIKIPSMRSGAIETILKTLYERDINSEIHSRRVSQISETLAQSLQLSRQDVSEVKTAALLHDIGKILISHNIINKDGKLTKEEFIEVKNHPEVGYRILNSTQQMRDISTIVLHHHERWDGLGYPIGIRGEDIPLKSRIISIADAFDAMTSVRSYQDMRSNEDALEEIILNSGKQFDPELVKVFKDNFTEICKNTDTSS